MRSYRRRPHIHNNSNKDTGILLNKGTNTMTMMPVNNNNIHHQDYDESVVSTTHSTAHSTTSHFSAGFKAHFEWLFLPSSSQTLSEDQWKDKEERIQKALAGDEQGVVDLWLLRELALSPGGLLCPALRKQAWPKLIGCHEMVLQVASSGDAAAPTPALVTPCTEDMQALKRDVSKTIWSVEDYLNASREQQKLQEEKLQHFLSIQRQRNKKVSFAMDVMTPKSINTNINEDDEHGDSNSPPQTIATSPSSNDDDEMEDDEASLLSEEADCCEEALNDSCSYDPSETTQSTAFTLSSRVVRWRRATISEQKILYNVILSILRTQAEPSEYFVDDRFHYFSGLQDLCALLLINLESPSLTSLLLTKLAGCHLRDALRKDRIMIDMVLSRAFFPLLEWVDEGLYRHLHRYGMTLPTFSRQWVACWFAQDIPDVAVASRLADAFLVSHPLMPLYTSVALLTTSRDQIMNCDSHLSTLYTMLRGLPVQAIFEQDDRMKKIEEILSCALSYMKKLPPKALVEMVKNRSPDCLILPSVAMFQDVPAWSTVSDVPSDYKLLQKARQLRTSIMEEDFQDSNETETDDKPSIPDLSQLAKYPLAAAAAGLTPHADSQSKNRKLVLVFGAVTVFLLLSTGSSIYIRRPSKVKSSSLSYSTQVPALEGLPAKKTSTRFMKQKVTKIFVTNNTPTNRLMLQKVKANNGSRKSLSSEKKASASIQKKSSLISMEVVSRSTSLIMDSFFKEWVHVSLWLMTLTSTILSIVRGSVTTVVNRTQDRYTIMYQTIDSQILPKIGQSSRKLVGKLRQASVNGWNKVKEGFQTARQDFVDLYVHQTTVDRS